MIFFKHCRCPINFWNIYKPAVPTFIASFWLKCTYSQAKFHLHWLFYEVQFYFATMLGYTLPIWLSRSSPNFDRKLCHHTPYSTDLMPVDFRFSSILKKFWPKRFHCKEYQDTAFKDILAPKPLISSQMHYHLSSRYGYMLGFQFWLILIILHSLIQKWIWF